MSDEPTKDQESDAPQETQVEEKHSDKGEDTSVDQLQSTASTQDEKSVAAAIHDDNKPPAASAGIIILQWLTYAFWGWTTLSLIWLAYIAVATAITQQDTSSMVPYAIAASLVLLPIAILCDVFYLRHEPVKKHGAAMVVMVIHAVIFALCGIGVLITAVLTMVQLSIGTTGETSGLVAWIITAGIGAVVYLLTFLRTLNPMATSLSARWYWITMLVVVGGFIIAGFVGPVAQARLVQDDRDLETNIELLASAINTRSLAVGHLPDTLGDITLSAKQKELISKGLLTYVKESPAATSLELRYQLCAVYKRQSSYYSTEYTRPSEEYTSYVSTSMHGAGKVCYKVGVSPEDRSAAQ